MRNETNRTDEHVAKYGFLVGAALVGCAVTWEIVAVALGVRLPGWELQLVRDAELLGAGIGTLALAGTLVTAGGSKPTSRTRIRPETTVYMTRGLFELLCGLAADAEPADRTIGLTTVRVDHLDGDTANVPPETPVFTHFYLPGVAEPTTEVFGIDLGVPPDRTRGLFVSHPKGPLALTKRDDLHGIVFVAVPPWDRGSVVPFDRHGRKHHLRLVRAAPPEESVPGLSALD